MLSVKANDLIAFSMSPKTSDTEAISDEVFLFSNSELPNVH